MHRIFTASLTLFLTVLISHVASAQLPENKLSNWIAKVGSRSEPRKTRNFSANVYGARPDGSTNSTKAIQKAIDECSNAGGGVVTLEKGDYVTGAIFLKNNVHLKIDTGVTLLGSQ